MTAIRWLETDTGNNQNISSAVAIGAYTAGADRLIMVQSFLDQVAGNGDYVMYLTVQVAGVGSSYVVLPKTTMTAEIGETAFAAQSGWVAVRSGDIVTVYVDGLAGDTTTPDFTTRWFEDAALQPTTPDQTIVASNLDAAISAIPASHWSYTTRTLTQSAAQVADIVSGSSITCSRGDTLTAALTGIGALTGYVSVDFTVKASENDTDAQAIIRIRKNASGLSDGLLTLNGATPTAALGSITIDSEPLGNITITLAASATDDLVAGQGYFYDVQLITATAVTTKATGTFNVSPDITRAIV